MDKPVRSFARSIPERFEKYTDRRGPDECWPWTGAIGRRDGYGLLYVGDHRHVNAHRWAYEHYVGPIPDGSVIDHTCHNQSGCRGGNTCQHRRCVNPAHLEPVVRRVNSQRSPQFDPGLCMKGLHDITDPANVYVDPAGRRRCRACRLASNRAAEHRARSKE